MDPDHSSVPDCTSCKWIGAGGCFAGAAYAIHQRSQMPATNRNRQWLALIGVGESDFAVYHLCPRASEKMLVCVVLATKTSHISLP